MFSFLRARRKRNTIRRYVTQLGPMLARRYGKAEFYSTDRVREAIQENGLPPDEAAYALVLYCTPERFAADQAARGGGSGYWQLRTEIMEYDFRHGPDRTPGDGNIGTGFCDSDPGFGHTGHGGSY